MAPGMQQTMGPKTAIPAAALPLFSPIPPLLIPSFLLTLSSHCLHQFFIKLTKANNIVPPKFFCRFRAVGGREEMCSASRASLVVAASVGAVEALKDQAGLCRWNYAIRSLNQQAKNSIDSFSQASRMSSFSSSSSIDRRKGRDKADEEAKQLEESLKKVMYLSCWGPN